MKHSRLLSLAGLGLLIVSVAACGSDSPPDEGLVEDLGSLMPGEPEVPDAAETVPDNVTVLFADDLLHVSRIMLRPGESVPEIESGHRLYFKPLGTAELAVDNNDVQTMTTLVGGDVYQVEPGMVSITNVGTLPIQLIEVARTEVALPEFLESERRTTAERGKLLLDSDQVRVVELALEAGETAELSPAPVRLVYSMNDSVLEYHPTDGDSVEIPSPASAVYIRPGDDVSVGNQGQEPATIVLFDWFV
jgi:hypothetical protein